MLPTIIAIPAKSIPSCRMMPGANAWISSTVTSPSSLTSSHALIRFLIPSPLQLRHNHFHASFAHFPEAQIDITLVMVFVCLQAIGTSHSELLYSITLKSLGVREKSFMLSHTCSTASFHASCSSSPCPIIQIVNSYVFIQSSHLLLNGDSCCGCG